MSSPLTSQHARRVLVVGLPEGDDDPALPVLQRQFELALAQTSAEAVRLLGESEFDLIVTSPAALAPLARSIGTSDTERVLRDISQAVCIVDRDGRVVWQNERLKSYPPGVVEALRSACAEHVDAFDRSLADDGAARSRRETVAVERAYFLDLTVLPLLDEQGRVERLIGLASDVSASRRMQDKLDAIDDAGRELVRIDAETLAEMDVQDRLNLLEERIISACRDLLNFEHFAVLLVDKHSGRLETLIASGISDAEALGMVAAENSNGVCGYVAATGQPYLSPDVSKDPRYLPGLEGARSCLAVPLRLSDRVIGVLNVESERLAAFTPEDVQFAMIIGRYIALALHMLQLLVVERRATTGQIAADVDAESATPLNDIVADVAAIMEDFADHPDLVGRLRAILTDVDRVKQAIHAVTEPKLVSGVIPDEHRADPLLANKRILVADDEDIIRETISEVLSGVGALTTMARDGNEAIRQIHAQKFDLVLSDIKMPNRNGYEVFAAAREASAECPVILITGFGYDPDHNIVRASREGLAGVLFKPFKVDQLIEQVHAALSNARK